MSTPDFAPLEADTVTDQWARCLVDELVRQGVDTFFVAPGSRSTPLTVTVAEHPGARVVLHLDERGTAFAALGYGRATGRPAGWITTSGTAVANGLPAVVEAHTDGVPMVLLTADRPPELRDSGANQTIDQVKIFGDYVCWEKDLPAPTPAIELAFVLTTAGQAIGQAQRPPRGPVHLNCMFRKPLEPGAQGGEAPRETVAPPVRTWAQSRAPYHPAPAPLPTASTETMDMVAGELANIERGVLIAGQNETPSSAIQSLAAHLRWPVLPDVTSQLRCSPDPRSLCMDAHDALLASDAFGASHAPEAALHLGGRTVSKRLRLLLRDAAPRPWVVARPDPRRLDPDHRVTCTVETDIDGFADALRNRLPQREASSWLQSWQAANRQAQAALRDALSAGTAALSEPLVAHHLPRLCPPEHALVVASSLPVREVHRFGAVRDAAGGPVIANRGASGIDGTVATAAGVAHGRQQPVTLLIGDLALGHDISSLALCQDVPVVIVLLNNDGGGIFHFLPIREHDAFEPYFTTPQGRTFRAAAELYQLRYAAPETPAAFGDAYRQACAADTSTLIEVRTEREATRALHDMLDERVVAAVDEATTA